jgi:hypothetical protein
MFEELDTEPSLLARIIPIVFGFVAAFTNAHYHYVDRYIVPALFKRAADQATLDRQQAQLARTPFDEACRQAVTQYLKTGTMSSIEAPLPPQAPQNLACTVATAHQ